MSLEEILEEALVAEPLSPLLKGHVAQPVQIGILLVSVAFALASVIGAFGRLRGAHRRGEPATVAP